MNRAPLAGCQWEVPSEYTLRHWHNASAPDSFLLSKEHSPPLPSLNLTSPALRASGKSAYTLRLVRRLRIGPTRGFSLESAATTNDLDGRRDGHDRLARRAALESARPAHRRGVPLPGLRLRLP